MVLPGTIWSLQPKNQAEPFIKLTKSLGATVNAFQGRNLGDPVGLQCYEALNDPQRQPKVQ